MIEVFYWFLLVSVLSNVSLQEQNFAIEPQDQTAVIGSKVTLPCRVINKSGNLQWTRDDFALGHHRNLSDYVRYQMVGSDDEGDFSLAIDQISLEDDAKFQCQVGPGKNGEPGIRSRFARLKVLVPPERPEILQGKEMNTTEDGEIELECVSKGGKPAAEIVWIDGLGNVVTQNAHFWTENQPNDLITARSTLKIIPKRVHHNTTFVCQAQNSAERQYQSAKLQLFVKYAPKVTLELVALPNTGTNSVRWREIVEGADVKIMCHVDANPSDLKYRWYLDDELVFPKVPTEYVIRNISRLHHESIVKCEAYNAIGKSEDSKTLNILYAPRFVRPPESIHVDPTTAAATLLCQVDGNPPAEISWTHDKFEKKLVGHIFNMTVPISNETTGKYECKASSPPFPEITSVVYVLVKGKPIIHRPPIQFGSLGDNVQVNCDIHSVPTPVQITWSFNGEDLRPDIREEYSVSQDTRNDSGAVRSTLEIRNAKLEQFGVYNCTALNDYGADSAEVILRSQSRIFDPLLSESISLLLPLIGILGAVIIATVILLTLSCHRKIKTKPPTPPTIVIDLEDQCNDSDRSSNVSDLKLEISTGSSTSHPNGNEYHAVYDSNCILRNLGPSNPSLNLGSKYSINRFSLSNFSDPTFLSALDDHKKSGYLPNVLDLLKDYNPLYSSAEHSQNHSDTNSLKKCKTESSASNSFNRNLHILPANASSQPVSSPHCAQRNGCVSSVRYSNQLSQSPTSQYIVAYNTDTAIIKKGSLATHV